MLSAIFDVISNVFNWVWGAGKSVSRINFNAYYAKLEYPTAFIEQHKNAPGVGEVYNKLEKAHNDLRTKRANIKEKESRTDERKFTRWKKARLVKVISKRLFVVSLLLSIIGGNVDSNIIVALVNLLVGACVFSVPVWVVSKLIELILKRSYINNFKRIENDFLLIKKEYLKIEKILEKEMDDLCLASLSETERMQERHHRELVYLEEKHHREMMESEKRHSRELSSLKGEIREVNRKYEKSNKDLEKIKTTFNIK